MTTSHDVAQISDFDSGVDLSGGKVLVAEKQLDVPEAGSVLKEMGCAAMPENMRGDSEFNTGLLGVVMEAVADSVAAHPVSERRDEESGLPGSG